MTAVADAYVRSLEKLLRCVGAVIGIKRTFPRKILTKLKMKPCVPRLIHGLLEDDPDRKS